MHAGVDRDGEPVEALGEHVAVDADADVGELHTSGIARLYDDGWHDFVHVGEPSGAVVAYDRRARRLRTKQKLQARGAQLMAGTLALGVLSCLHTLENRLIGTSAGARE